ncbi:putative holin [Klebsiella variicola]|uniref:putative holin n=1 Tax=Klebsiella variicola TaxID=244366 RepID=UPI00313B351C
MTLYKLSLVSIAAILGYHPDRALFPYATPGSYLIEDWKENLGKPVPVSRNEPEYPVATGYELILPPFCCDVHRLSRRSASA